MGISIYSRSSISSGRVGKERIGVQSIKQKDFAKKLGLSYYALNEILNGSVPLQLNLCEYYQQIHASFHFHIFHDWKIGIIYDMANHLLISV